MKQILQTNSKRWLGFCLLMLLSWTAKAQSIEILDTLYKNSCDTNRILRINGGVNGYNGALQNQNQDTVSITIDYGDGTTEFIQLGYNNFAGGWWFTTEHYYTNYGSYIVNATATLNTSNGVLTDTNSQYISFTPPPTTSITHTEVSNGLVQFNATTSASNYTTSWYGPDDLFALFAYNTLNPTKTFNYNGDYIIYLTVYDTISGCSNAEIPDTVHITTAPNNPEINIIDTTFYGINCNYLNWSVKSTILGVLNRTRIKYSVDFGDGTTITNDSVYTYNSYGYWNFVNHEYAFPGSYTIRIIGEANTSFGLLRDTLIKTININGCGNLEGIVYNDIDNDCNQSNGEYGVAGIAIELKQGSATVAWAWTDSAGHYSFNVPVGNYLIQIGNGLSAGYAVTCGNGQPHITNVATSGTSVENFPIHCAGFDVGVTEISLMSGFYPGVTDYILPHVGMFNNSCNVSLPGKVIMTLDPKISYVGIYQYSNTPTPTSVVGNVITWDVADINNIGTFGYWDYAVEIMTDTTVQLGDTACITIQVLPTNGDANVANNTYTRCFEIGVAYDPNMKEAHNPGKGPEGYIAPNTNELKYTIHFQNTGTAPARNIYLLDTLSANLDLSSLKVIASSHEVQTYYNQDNRTLKFMFANINLADSTHNEPASHGSVTYSIAPKAGLMNGAQIKNTAHIYFDYNTAIVTNTTLHTIDITLGIQQVITRDNSLYPNPAKNELFISNGKASQVIVRDVTGKEIFAQQLSGSSVQKVDISALPTGMYFVTLSGTNYTETVKVVKVN